MNRKKSIVFLLLVLLIFSVPMSVQAALDLNILPKTLFPSSNSALSLDTNTRIQWKWKSASAKEIQIRFPVKNLSTDKTIKAFELYVYATDVWGDKIYGKNSYYRFTTKKNIKPGAEVYSDYLTLPERRKLSRIYYGIKRYIFTDGTRVDFSDDQIRFFYAEYSE